MPLSGGDPSRVAPCRPAVYGDRVRYSEGGKGATVAHQKAPRLPDLERVDTSLARTFRSLGQKESLRRGDPPWRAPRPVLTGLPLGSSPQKAGETGTA